MSSTTANILEAQVKLHLRTLRGQAVILDSDLAWFLGTDPAQIIAAVEHQPEAFPDDFVFRLTQPELNRMVRRTPCLTGTGLSQNGTRLAFTMYGTSMLLLVVKDEKFASAAIQVLYAFASFGKETEPRQNTQSLLNRQ